MKALVARGRKMVNDDKFLCKKKNSAEKTDFLAGHRGISEISETGISQFQ